MTQRPVSTPHSRPAGRHRPAASNEAVLGWFQGAEYEAADRATLIRERRKKFSDIPAFDEREITAEGRKW